MSGVIFVDGACAMYVYYGAQYVLALCDLDDTQRAVVSGIVCDALRVALDAGYMLYDWRLEVPSEPRKK